MWKAELLHLPQPLVVVDCATASLSSRLLGDSADGFSGGTTACVTSLTPTCHLDSFERKDIDFPSKPRALSSRLAEEAMQASRTFRRGEEIKVNTNLGPPEGAIMEATPNLAHH